MRKKTVQSRKMALKPSSIPACKIRRKEA